MPVVPLLRLAVVLVPLVVLVGCGPAVDQIERQIERELPALIGPADQYTVSIDGANALTGEARRVTIVGERVQVEGGPVVDRLNLEMRGVRFDTRNRRIDRVDEALGTARLLPRDLAAYIEQTAPVRGATVTLQAPDEAVVRARPDVGFDLPRGVAADVTGRLEAEDGQVRFVVSDVRAVGAALSPAVGRRLSDAINPLLDAGDLPAGLAITALRVEDGVLVLEATGDPTQLRLR